ncbi:MAG: FAD-binding oxidoreductase [Myxococcota bacterium]|nr:FAD-binding oxidoreductase [Myxococcota bacterium]
MSDIESIVRELEALVGSEGVRASATSLLGVEAPFEISPADGKTLARVLELLLKNEASAVVRGGGTHDELGNQLGPVAVALSTRQLEGIEEFVEQDGVVRVRAGTRVSELRSSVESSGWDVALDTAGLSPSDTSTVGGTLAAGAFGARRLGYGPPRDCVLGLDVALATGERTHCGARVVKNVTGYDLQKLYCGSMGSLGVIEAAWLRLRPLPERVASLVAHIDSPGDPVGATLGLSIARRSTARSVALLDSDSASAIGLPSSESSAGVGFSLVVEFAGPSVAVDEDVSWTRAHCEADSAPDGVIDALSALPTSVPGIVARLAMLPSAVSRCVGELQASGAAVVAHPGLGLVHTVWSSGEGAPSDERSIVREVGRIASSVRATFRFERMPVRQREAPDIDVFGNLERGQLQLMRALKQKYDPSGVLNPGRSAGHI